MTVPSRQWKVNHTDCSDSPHTPRGSPPHHHVVRSHRVLAPTPIYPIDQREIGLDTQGFTPKLRTALRQDPDVIFVGEIRDVETIAKYIAAAETGHLVSATLSTSDTVQTIERIVDVFPAGQQPQVRIYLV